MERILALKAADEMVGVWMEQVKNGRGYVHDAWRPADPAARTEAVLQLAEFLMKPEPTGRVVPPTPPSTRLLCSSCVQPLAEAPGHGCTDETDHRGPTPIP